MADDTQNVGTQDDTQMSSGNSLFPEDDTPTDGTGNGHDELASQIAALAPEELSTLAQALDPAVRLNLAQSVFAALSPEEKQQLDVTQTKDVEANMANATPERPEEQYRMSIGLAEKRLSGQDGMKVLAVDKCNEWVARAERLHSNGYMDEARLKEVKDSFSDESKRFSVLLDDRGNLHDICLEIEVLEKSMSKVPALSKSLLGQRFSSAIPVSNSTGDSQGFDTKRAEEHGSRLARI